MKIKFNAKSVLPQVTTANSVINSKNAIEVLDNLLIEPRIDSNGRRMLLITASDTETWITCVSYIDEIDECGNFCVNAGDLMRALGNVDGMDITATFDTENSLVKFDYGKGFFSLPYESDEFYPRAQMDKTDTESMRIESGKLMTAIEKVGFATATNNILRPILECVHFDLFEYGMVTAATDTNKMAKYMDSTVTRESGSVGQFSLPKKPSTVLYSILSSSEYDGDIIIEYNKSHATFKCKDFKIETKLSENSYPPYERVINHRHSKSTTIDRQEMIGALKRVMPLGNTKSRCVYLSFSEGNISVNAEYQEMSKAAEENVACDYSGEEVRIGVNGAFLIQCLQNMGSEYFVAEFESREKFILLYEQDGIPMDNYVLLIMPIL